MRSRVDSLRGWFELLLLAAMLVGWSGASQGGGFNGPQSTVSIEIRADKTTLPVNIFGVGPSTSNAYTATVYVTVRRNGGIYAVPGIQISVAQGLSSGALYYLDGDPEHETCTTNAAGVETCVPNAYRTVVFEDTTGTVSAHFLASGTPGTVVLRATAQDPSTGKTISDDLTLNVSAVGSAPSSVKFAMDPALVYIRDNPLGTTPVTQNTVKPFNILVLDDGGLAVGAGAGNNNLRVEMLPNRPNGGEWLSTADVQGNPQEGTRVLTGTVGGLASLTLHSGTLPGTVVISATADRADNNVDNGIQRAITNYAMVSIGTGEIKSLTFTGPFADTVFSRGNNLVACVDSSGTSCQIGGAQVDRVWNGIYNRIITVIASDAFGNPPPAGTPITFRLIDSPLDMLQNRYPDQGHGQFAITGTTGDPAEGGDEFHAPNRKTKRTASDTLSPFVVPNGVSLAIANPLCVLMLQDPEVINPNPSTVNALPSEGRLEYHVGSRIITGRPGNNTLTVNTPFNQVSQNVGANVWWAVGCPPHKGNVSNFNSDTTGPLNDNTSVVLTNDSGVASTLMNYPANQVGRRFMVAAESNGGKVGAVMTHWYLGMPNGILTITQPASLVASLGNFFAEINPDVLPINIPNWPARVQVTETVDPGTAVSLPVTLQVLDGGVCKAWSGEECVQLARAPVPGVPITVDIVINDPDEALAVAAEEALAQAQAAYDAFVAANPGVCDQVVTDATTDPPTIGDRDPEKCDKQKGLATALDDAKIAAVEARALANLHSPTASVTPETLASVGGGYARAVLNVNDLPTDGSVDFFFSTVGPDVSSQTLQITVQPPPPPEETP